MFFFQKIPIFISLLIATSLLMILVAIFGVVTKDFYAARSFFYFGLLILLISLFIAFTSFNRSLSLPIRSQLLVITTSFFIFPIIFTLPLLSLLPELDNHTLYFEMISAFTTTGLTGMHAITGISDTILFWQTLVAWSGGLLIWTFYFSIFKSLDINNIFTITGKKIETEQKTFDSKQIHHTIIFLNTFSSISIPYTILTIVLWGLLTLTGENTFLALTHSMSTMSTSGISPNGGMINPNNGIGLIIIFLFLFFALSSNALLEYKSFSFSRKIFSDTEVKVAVQLVIFGTLALVLLYFQNDYLSLDLITYILNSIFTCLSFLTTTGWYLEPKFYSNINGFVFLLAGLALIGGGIGTTAGGLKLFRFLIIKRHLRSEFGKMIYPSIIRTSESRMTLNGSVILKVWVFFSTFIFCIILSFCLLSFFGLSFMDAIFLSISAFSNTGPLYEVASQATSLYEILSTPIKYILILSMVLGRIEILVLFALFNIELWQK